MTNLSSNLLSFLKRARGDIRTYLGLAFLIRLYGITHPPLEPSWSWREADVLMVARNFLEVSSNILYPRLDIAGHFSGISVMEFPLLNYSIYLISLLFGYDHWYGRLINLSLSTVAVFYYYRLIRDWLGKQNCPGEKLAFYSAILLTFSLWITYSRKTMPDIFAVSLVMIGLYYGINYLYRSASSWKLSLYWLFGTFGILAKIPAAILYVIFILPVMDRGVALQKKILFLCCSLIVLIPTYFWYFYWVPHLIENYGRHFIIDGQLIHQTDQSYFFMGVPLFQGAKELVDNFLDRIAFRFYRSAIGYSGFLLLIFGFYQAIKDHHRKILYLLLAISLALLAYMLKAGKSFWQANYILPFVPVMALLAGYGLKKIKSFRVAVSLLLIVCLENIASRQHEFRIPEKHKTLVRLESFLDQFSQREDIIAINTAPTSIPSYMAHRKSWKFTNEELKKANTIEALKKYGCKYIIILKRGHGKDLILNLPQVGNEHDFRAYSIDQ